MILILIVMAGWAVFYYKIGEVEYSHGALLAGASVLLWLASDLLLGCGFFACIGIQVGMFVILTIVNVVRSRPA